MRREILNINRALRAYEPRKDGFCPVQFRMYRNGADIKIQTGVYALPKDWEMKRQRVRPHVDYAEKANGELDRLEKDIRRIYEKALSDAVPFTRQYIEKHLRGGNAPESPDFIQFARQWLLKRTDLSTGTVAQLNSELNKLEAWRSPIRFDALTRKTISDYQLYLTTDLENNPNTVQRTMKKLRMFCAAAVMQEIIASNPFDGLRFKGVAPDEIECLLDWELEAIEKYAGKHEKTAKLFLLQCYTGFAHTDMDKFRPEHIHMEEGRNWISKNRQKSDINALIPMFARTAGILEYFDFETIGKLPVPSQQTYNGHLKDVAAELKLKTPLSSHVGRKTAGMVLLDYGLSLEVVSRILGHKSVTTTQKWYAKVRARRISLETQGFTRFD